MGKCWRRCRNFENYVKYMLVILCFMVECVAYADFSIQELACGGENHIKI